MSISTVCFTGHRPSDLGTTPAIAKSALRKAITEAIKRGATTFIAGGAIGVDTYASQLVLEAKASNPSIKLYIAVPFRGFTKYWSNAQRVEYADIIRKCDGFKVICDKPSKHAYHVRNSFMVDRADLVIAYWSGKRSGGTYATVQYAQQTHTPVVNCYPKEAGSKEPASMQFRGDYWFLSNFYPCKVTFGGLEFGCVESAFQAMKCANKADREKFVKLTGAEAKKLGRKIKMRSDWNKVKDDVMFALVNEKFQDPKLMTMLKAVKEPIVENNTWNDTYWGVCNGKGENRLGKILMTVRDD